MHVKIVLTFPSIFINLGVIKQVNSYRQNELYSKVKGHHQNYHILLTFMFQKLLSPAPPTITVHWLGVTMFNLSPWLI